MGVKQAVPAAESNRVAAVADARGRIAPYRMSATTAHRRIFQMKPQQAMQASLGKNESAHPVSRM